MEGKGLMPKALKVVLTGAVALFSGVDGDYFPDCGVYESSYARGQETGVFLQVG